MAKEIESQFRAAVEALSLWVASAPIPHSSKEWRDRVPEAGCRGAALIHEAEPSL
jgi:hypothetical protein